MSYFRRRPSSPRPTSCWRVDVSPVEPFRIVRGDLAAIRTRWADLCTAHDVDPDRVKRRRNHLYDVSSLFVADIIERGAENTSIAAAIEPPGDSSAPNQAG